MWIFEKPRFVDENPEVSDSNNTSLNISDCDNEENKTKKILASNCDYKQKFWWKNSLDNKNSLHNNQLQFP